MNETALTLPDEKQFLADLQAIKRFQQIVNSQMVRGHDHGVIPGTQKPTLLKPGAEKITKLLGLADRYEILDRQEDWDKGRFRYIVKCTLISITSGVVISEGLGECNSMEGRYRWRWVFESQLPDNMKPIKGELFTRTTKNKIKQYRLENDDIYTLVNTFLKMAKKRSLVDAALSAGRLSDVFTQDVEDIAAHVVEAEYEDVGQPEPSPTTDHWCPIHNTEFFKRGKMKNYAHKIEGTDKWCNEDDVIATEIPPAKQTTGSQGSQVDAVQFRAYASLLGFDGDEQICRGLGIGNLKEWTGKTREEALEMLFKSAQEDELFTTCSTWQEAIDSVKGE